MYWDRVAKFYDLFEGLINKKVYEGTVKCVSVSNMRKEEICPRK